MENERLAGQRTAGLFICILASMPSTGWHARPHPAPLLKKRGVGTPAIKTQAQALRFYSETRCRFSLFRHLPGHGDGSRRERLDRGLCPNQREDRREQVAMRGDENPGAGAVVLGSNGEGEHGEHYTGENKNTDNTIVILDMYALLT